jgi:two-component system nitrate/nitrite response regulator NarL
MSLLRGSERAPGLPCQNGDRMEDFALEGTNAPGPSTVLVVDDDAQIRLLLRNVLVGEPGVRVIAVGDGEQGLLRAWEVGPALVLADLLMPGMDGATFCRLLRAHPVTAHTPIIAISGADPASERARVLRAQCVAWFGKPFEVDSLVASARRLLAMASPRRPATEVELSPRQREVAGLIARGMSNKDIASALVLTEGTVANHVRRILVKLGLRSRTQLAVWSVERGRPSGR